MILTFKPIRCGKCRGHIKVPRMEVDDRTWHSRMSLSFECSGCGHTVTLRYGDRRIRVETAQLQ